MLNQKLLSVIVPIYRVENYLEKCLSSITSQTYENLEIILVDDGSDDLCPELCDKWAQKDKRITVIHKKNEGLVASRKAGVIASHGEYIGYVDPDDWIECNMYSCMMNMALVNDAEIVCSGWIDEYADKRVMHSNRVAKGLYVEGQNKVQLCSQMLSDDCGILFNLYPVVWNKIFKRDILAVWQSKVPNEIVIGEDVACSYAAVLNAKKIYVMEDCFYHYNRYRNDSMLKNKDKKAFDRLYVMADYLRSEFGRFSEDYDLDRQINDYLYDLGKGRVCNQLGVHPPYKRVNGLKYLFPYELVPHGSDVIVWGKGRVGRELVDQITYNHYCSVIAWLDKKEYGIEKLREIPGNTYQYIVIAVKSRDLKKEIAKELYPLIEKLSINLIWKEYSLTE